MMKYGYIRDDASIRNTGRTLHVNSRRWSAVARPPKVSDALLLRPRELWRSTVMSASVCLSDRNLRNHMRGLYDFFVRVGRCCLCLWLGPPPACLR